jgi:GNAT superfamily N-acetyltransferase
METRYLSLDEIPEIINLAKIGVQDVKYWDRIDDEIVTKTLTEILHHPDYFCKGYYDDKNNLVGAFCGRIVRSWFSSDMQAEGITIFILPNARGRGGALKLYQEFTEWAKGFDRVKYISLRTTSGLDLTKIIHRCGYKTTGFTYRLEIER